MMNTERGKSTLGRATVSLLAAASIVGCISSQEEEASPVSVQQRAAASQARFAGLRQATARYHDLGAATADGFLLGIHGGVMGCIAHPTLGAMGYHYANEDRFMDPTINEFEPEVLVYHTAEDGSRKLGAVEWVVRKEDWEAAHGGPGAPAPVVYGRPLTVLNPVLNYYVAHAWIWKPNPSGILSDWNPDVTCP